MICESDTRGRARARANAKLIVRKWKAARIWLQSYHRIKLNFDNVRLYSTRVDGSRNFCDLIPEINKLKNYFSFSLSIIGLFCDQLTFIFWLSSELAQSRWWGAGGSTGCSIIDRASCRSLKLYVCLCINKIVNNRSDIEDPPSLEYVSFGGLVVFVSFWEPLQISRAVAKHVYLHA